MAENTAQEADLDMAWHDEIDRATAWGTLDPHNACMCTDCVLETGNGAR